PAAGYAFFTGGSVVAPDGADAMRGVAVLPPGDLVAVGQSVDLRPRTWLRRGGQDWRYVAPSAPDRPGSGGLVDVAVAGGRTPRIVAVGWAAGDQAAPRRPAVWLSTTG